MTGKQLIDNEPIYDEKIGPLMRQVLAICKEHKIPMFVTFQLTDADQPLMCTSRIGISNALVFGEMVS